MNIPIIPRSVFFGSPKRLNVKISPDGNFISYLAPINGILNIWVAPVDKPQDAYPITSDTTRNILKYVWTYNNRKILYLQDTYGDENWQIYSVDVFSGEKFLLTPFNKAQSQIIHLSPNFPDKVLISTNARNPQLHDLYIVDIENANYSLLLENKMNFFEFIIDDAFRQILAKRMIENGDVEVYLIEIPDKYELFTIIPYEDTLTTTPLAFDECNDITYWITSINENTAALKKINVKIKAEETIFQDSRCDVSDVLLHPLKKKVILVSSTFLRKEWHAVDKSFTHHLDIIKSAKDGDFEISSTSLSLDKLIITYNVSDGPLQYYLYDVQKKEITYLFSSRPELENLPLSKMHPIIIKSRDGFDLTAYITLPLNYEFNKGKEFNYHLPLILYVHGGPWFRDAWGYNPIHQWLSNRGYAVLSVNFRGSTGFGKKFINAADKEWGGKMLDDLIDAVNWCFNNKIASRDKVAIMGGSYGGYATLSALAFHPRVFKCGIAICAPSNLITFIESIPPYWIPLKKLLIKRVGDIETEEGRKFLMSRSPINYIDNISSPLLIAHGANDPRVKISESEQIVEKLREKGLPVKYLLFPDEGHGSFQAHNNLALFALIEEFLHKHLPASQFQPLGDEIQNSSVKIDPPCSICV